MQKLLFIFLSLITTTALMAQGVPKIADKKKLGLTPKNDRLDNVLVIPKYKDTVKQKEYPDQIQKLRQRNRASLSHTTPNGKVYSMRPSNMPCLVPNMNALAPMPIKPMPNSLQAMPNPFKKEEIIPKEK